MAGSCDRRLVAGSAGGTMNPNSISMANDGNGY